MSSESTSLVAIFDVGKTNTKLSLIDPQLQKETWSARRSNAVVTATYGKALDIVGIEQWLMESLHNAPNKDRIRTIVPVAHGAAAVLIGDAGEILAAPDYEDDCFSNVNEEYQRIRDAFTDTFSPNLPAGLNLGRQWYYLQQHHAGLFSCTKHILLYPQYWAWRLSGILASELSSLGCHSDVWHPRTSTYSALAQRQGWTKLLPPLRRANDILGAVTSRIIDVTGLSPNCNVACGIHDSNASWLRFLIGRELDPFTVVSSGTWTVVMTNHGELSRLQEERDMLANVDVFGFPIPTARYMGGREYEIIASGNGNQSIVAPTVDTLHQVIRVQAMALPTFAVAGPYQHRQGYVKNADALNDAERAALATVYSALMTKQLIESLNVASNSDIFIDGPFANNVLFAPLLATLLPTHHIKTYKESTGIEAVVWLSGFNSTATSQPLAQITSVEPLHVPGLKEYLDAYLDSWIA